MLYNDSRSIYIVWDYTIRTNVAYYKILKSLNFNGDYEEIDIIPFPANDYYDANGTPFDYYKVVELDANMNVLSTMGPFVGEEALIKQSLYYQVRDLLEVNVSNELAIFDYTRTKAKFQHGNWNYWNPLELRITSAEPGGFSGLSDHDPIFQTTLKGGQNYPDGLLIKPNYQGVVHTVNTQGNPQAVQPYDDVVASYQIRMFTVREMNDALKMALSGITALPGTYKIENVAQAPFEWDAALISGAGYFLMRSLQTRILNQQTQRLLVNSNITPDYVKGLAATYKEDYEKYKETLPYSRYPHIFSIVSPTNTMPGGMSRMYRQIWHSGLG